MRIHVNYKWAAPLVLAIGLMIGRQLTAGSAQQGAPAVAIDADDIGGVVTGSNGPEAGVWVIAETTELPTKYSKIVVTDDRGRYVIPDLPKATYDVWVRGYGLVDSAKVKASPGKILNLTAIRAPDPHAAAQYYPANYWYAMLDVPPKSDFPGTGLRGNGIPETMTTQAQWLDRLKTSTCQACHQLGNKATREIPAALGSFDSDVAGWERRLESGQAGAGMSGGLGALGRQRALRMYGDWTHRIAGGELPSAVPPRPSGVERNLVVTQWDYGEASTYIHDAVLTDRWTPTVNANGPIYGTTEASANYLATLDPVKFAARMLDIPLRDQDAPFAAPQTAPLASPYWGTEIIWKGKTHPHSSTFDDRGRVWTTSVIRGPNNPDWCKAGSDLPSAKFFPIERSGRQLDVYDPKTKQFTLIDTCFGTHRLAIGPPNHQTLYFSSTGAGSGVLGWFDTKVFDETKDEKQAQGWAPFIIDYNGNGKRDAWTEPGQPRDPTKDVRLNLTPYSAVYNPVDGAVYLAINTFPGSIVRVTFGSHPPETTLTEVFEPPFHNPKAPIEGTVPRGIDVDSQGVIWTSLSGSSHLASFDRRKCKGPLNGPSATGQQCPEGWTLYPVPGPLFKGSDISADAMYYNWVDQFDTLGLGKDTPLAIGNGSDSLLALTRSTGKFVVLRVPYPLGFYAKGIDGRIDDPKAGWKGKGLWSSSGTRAPWHMEGGKGVRPKVTEFQLRPNPLAH